MIKKTDIKVILIKKINALKTILMHQKSESFIYSCKKWVKKCAYFFYLIYDIIYNRIRL